MKEKLLSPLRIKILAILSLILVFSALDLSLFLERTRKVGLYDRLIMRLDSVKTGIISLEYTLDMFVVARRFEDTTVSLLKKDVTRLGRHVKDVVENAEYAEVLQGNTMALDEVSAIRDDWSRIQEEAGRLNEAMTQDEVILLHNAVDVNTILISERSERLLGMLSESRTGVFREIRALIVANVSVFIFLSAAAALVFQRRIVRQLNSISSTARGISGGSSHLRFAASGIIGDFAENLNEMLETLEVAKKGRDTEIRDITIELARRKSQLQALRALTSASGRSLSREEVFALALKEVREEGGSDACGIYLYENGNLTLKASLGFDDFFLGEGSLIPQGALKEMEGASAPAVFSDLDEFPYERYGKLLKASGFAQLLTLPVSYERETFGYLYVAERRTGFTEESIPFFEAVASNIGVFTGYINLFHREHGTRKFLERVMNQVPFGIAVFDRDGSCVMLNNVLRKFYGISSNFDARHYNITEDDVFRKQGVLTSIQKSYEGFTTEFIINYDPSSAGKFMFTGRARKFKVTSLPLYDASGEISNIALLFEGLSEGGELEGEAL